MIRSASVGNEFKAAANFESGYSYAAELIPAEMNVHGVPFKLETREELNGMACKGNVLKLPPTVLITDSISLLLPLLIKM